MNELGKVIREGIVEAEKKPIGKKYGLKFHLMPPVGWLNDPNGLCQFHGEYHVFFQYGPFDVNGGLKVWGHYVSRDLLHWKYLGTPILPDEPWDCHGVYSGCAFTDDGEMELYYTGNVKLPGAYDYIHDGRESNTIRITSTDGRHFLEKELLLSINDYPDTYTRHIRDPKVFKRDGMYYMLLGGRKMEDHGAVLLYESADKKDWRYKREITTPQAFGYMWECPNLIEMKNSWFLAFSPQGLKREEFKNQNVYQSGYMMGKGDYRNEYELSEFIEWDMGFDFYAPQTFREEQGRILLIGWAGLPDIDAEYRNLSVEDGWQHALTVPREITRHGNHLYQYPIKELEELRREKKKLSQYETITVPEGVFDLVLEDIKVNDIEIKITEELSLSYQDNVFCMQFSGSMGAGRTIRRAKISEIHSIRLLCDVSLLEVYINEGEYVFTTRFYKKENGLTVMVDCKDAKRTIWFMEGMEVL